LARKNWHLDDVGSKACCRYHRWYYNKLLLAAEGRVEVKGITEICCFPMLLPSHHTVYIISLSLSPGFHRCAYARLGFLLNIDVGERKELLLQYLRCWDRNWSRARIHLDVPPRINPVRRCFPFISQSSAFEHNRAVVMLLHTHTHNGVLPR
jgi:hypothetical protein